MAPDIFKLLMQGQAPAMDNSASQGLNQQALELMMQAQSQPQAQVVSKPNTESILLSLLPAALGAGTDYIGSLGKNYLQGQQNEMARIDRQSQLAANQLMAQAKALSGQAGDMQDLELAQFNQANQNVRNAQNNLRMNAITQANNQTRSTIAGNAEAGRNMRFRDTNEGKVIKSMIDPLVASIKQLVASSPWDEKSQAFTDAQVNSIVQQFPQYAEKIRAMVPKYPLGFKSKDVLGTESRNRSMDMKAMSTARQMYYDGLKLGARTGYVGKDDVAQADDLRQTIAEAFTISPDLLALPQEGKAWQLVQAEANTQLRRDEFNYRKTKDEEDRADKIKAARLVKLNEQYEKESKQMTARHANVSDRFKQLTEALDKTQEDIAGETDDTKRESLQAKLDAINKQLDITIVGSIGYVKNFQDQQREQFENDWATKIEKAAPGKVAPFDPTAQQGGEDQGGGELYGSIGRPTDSKPTDLKPTDKSNKGKTLPAVNQPKAKSKAKSTQKSDSKTKAPSAPKQFSVGGTTFKKLS